MRAVCVTNNPLWKMESDSLHCIEGTAEAVFEAARDLVHRGWRFAAHPLYGNFSPLRHPYRTLVLTAPDDERRLDMESLTMLELALEVCRNDRENIGRIKELPQAIKDDFAQLDRSLMGEIVERYIEKGGRL